MESKWCFFIIVILVVSSVALTGCGGELGTKSSKGQKIVMKIGHTQPVSHRQHQSLLKFKEIVETNTNKMIEVQLFPGGQLGSNGQQLEMVRAGSLQAMRGNVLEAVAPELRVYSMPFLFTDIEAVHKITRGPIGKKIANFAQKNDVIILATGDAGGLSHITNNLRPITQPKDMRGLTISAPATESTIKTMEVMGAKNISVADEKLYETLKIGAVAGQENSLTQIAALNLAEVQQYLTITNCQYTPDPFVVSRTWYESLDSSQQNVIKVAAVEMMLYNDELVEKATLGSLRQLQKKMKVTVLKSEEREKFIEQVKPIYDDYINNGLFTAQDLEEIRNTIQ